MPAKFNLEIQLLDRGKDFKVCTTVCQKMSLFNLASRWETFQIASSHPNKILLFIINKIFYITYRANKEAKLVICKSLKNSGAVFNVVFVFSLDNISFTFMWGLAKNKKNNQMCTLNSY